jgi:hypothetical protein
MVRVLSLGLLLPLFAGALAVAESPKVTFKRTQLDPKFRSEGVAVADFNKDGKMDIAAGFVWYEAPDWKMHQITEKAPEYDPKGYSNAFCCFAEDVNGDGWSDLLVVDFPGTPTWWFENPKEPGKLWTKRTVTPVTNNESPQYLDIDGDGKRELLLGFAPDTKNSDGPDRQIGYAKPTKDPNEPWTLHAVSAKGVEGAKKYDHGIGIGDINGDGRNDILAATGWWEAPASAGETPWKFHAANFGGKAAQMYAYDFDGDGDNDVITSSPHAFGLWWHEQVGPNQWKQHEIDNSFSQIHGVILADMNGDKLPDIVCGKRWWAHAAGDPGVNDPAVFFWFELKRENGRPVWTPHQFDHNSGPGTQFEVGDVNGDGLLDIISSNKKGVHYFEQVRE